MIEPELKTLTSIDVDDLETWLPDSSGFSVTIDLEIGPTGDERADRFHLHVVSPAWLDRSMDADGMEDGRHLLLVKTFDYRRIRSWIDGVLARSAGDDWDGVAGKLTRYLAWEFEDYQDVRNDGAP